MNIKEIGRKSVDFIHLAPIRMSSGLVNKIMNFWASKGARKSLSGYKTVRLSRR
jgi:hypothetical protein